MKWNLGKSLVLTEICVFIFALLLLALDIFMYPFIGWYLGVRNMQAETARIIMMVILYFASVFGWLFLFGMIRLLKHLHQNEIFENSSVRCLRWIFWCLLSAGIIFCSGCFIYLPFLVMGISCFFIALIVRIVKNIFEQAIRMKSELDLTI